MKIKAVTYLLILGLLISCTSKNDVQKTALEQTTTTVPKFFNQDGQFKIQFEGEATAYAQDIPFENGKIRMNYFIYEKGINLIYCISYADYPKGFTSKQSADDFLTELLVDYIDNQKAGLEKQKKLDVKGYSAIYFKASNSDVFVYGEYILKGDRLFQLTVTKEGSYEDEANANAFFQSLEFL